MSIIVFTESKQNLINKPSIEAICYAKSIAEDTNKEVIAVTFNTNNVSHLKNYGADIILNINLSEGLTENSQVITHVLKSITEKKQGEIIIFSSSANGQYFAPILAGKLEASYASNTLEKPLSYKPFTVKRLSFSSKAIEHICLHTDIKIIALSRNCFGITPKQGKGIVENFETTSINSPIKIIDTKQESHEVRLEEADIVVSGGRGLQGAEHWYLIEDLARVLGGATACSKAVSDMGWRPHSEHVGQTGKSIACNLYIAVGISGAIQHIAGINTSKTKVVINSDPEAPFFKVADYGIIADAFEVVPIFIEKMKTFKKNIQRL